MKPSIVSRGMLPASVLLFTIALPAQAATVSTGAHDTVRAIIGWENATAGSATLDAISLTRR